MVTSKSTKVFIKLRNGLTRPLITKDEFDLIFRQPVSNSETNRNLPKRNPVVKISNRVETTSVTKEDIHYHTQILNAWLHLPTKNEGLGGI